jgi:hypothetical protein
MMIRGKIFAAAAVPVMAAGVALTAGGSAHAATQTAPPIIGYTVAAINAHSDGISDVTATFGTPATSVVGSTAVQVPTAAADFVQFGATDSLGAAITWSSSDLPSGFTLTSAGALTLATAPVKAPVTFTVKAAEGSAVAFATVNVGVGASTTPAEDGVSVTPDTVVLNAPANGYGKVFFETVPSGVAETLANGPAGAVFSNDVLSAGTAVPGDYTNVAVTAKDAAGATAVETFDAVVRPVYAPVPRLSGGHAVFITTARENVYYVQSGAASWDHFTIVGPGAINGHQGWVNGHLGLNTAVYGGLEYHHGYTVFYQPVTGPGSTTPVPGSHWGYVYFVS